MNLTQIKYGIDSCQREYDSAPYSTNLVDFVLSPFVVSTFFILQLKECGAWCTGFYKTGINNNSCTTTISVREDSTVNSFPPFFTFSSEKVTLDF